MKRALSFIVCLALILSIVNPLPAAPVYADSPEPIAIMADSFHSTNVSGDGTKLLWITGHAIATDGVARLVSSALWQAGTMVKSGRIQITNGFSTYFEVQIHNPLNNEYADGLSFLIYESNQPLVGVSGGGLGYKGITSSVAVEFDIWKNDVEFSDPNDRHIAIMQNGNSSHVANQPRIDYSALAGSVVRVWVDYDGSTLTATVGSSSAVTKGSIGNVSISQSNLTYLNNKDVFVGFSASTGGTGADHDILKWYFQDKYQANGLLPYASDGQLSGSYSQAASTIGIALDQAVNPSKASITLSDVSGDPLENQSFTVEIDGTSQGSVDVYGNSFNTSSSGIYDFSIPANLSNGLHKIEVIAPGGATNSVNFTVEKFKILYYGNGASGTTTSTPAATSIHTSGSSVIVAGKGSLARGAYTFDGWNTKADGTGTSYSAGSGQILMNANVNLYAQWKALSASSGTVQAYLSGTAVVVDPEISVIDSNTTFEKATIMIQNLKTGDQLTCSAINGISANYNANTGVLTLTGSTTGAVYQNALRNVKFATTSSNRETRIIRFSLGSSLYNEGNGHYYEYVATGMSWTDAKNAAAGRVLNGMTGYLATITSNNENTFITGKLLADAWIGASDDPTYAGNGVQEGYWYWVTGPEAGILFSSGNINPVAQNGMYNNWNNKEPNDSGSNEDYGEIYSSTGIGSWNDLTNSSSMGYVVEYGGLPSDTPVIMQASRSVTLIGPPDAPTNISVASGNGQATVSFTAPASNGGSAITSYLVTASPGNITAAGMSSSITITGLTNGQNYTFSVKAKNVVGYGSTVTSNQVGLPSSVNFQSNGGSAVASITNVAPSATISSPTAPTRAGYDFVAWYRESGLTNLWNFASNQVTGDITLYAKWNAATNIAYRVEHYQQDISGTSYSIVSSDTQNLTGTTGAIVTAAALSYTDFFENTTHTSRVPSGTIAADGSLVLKLYYNYADCTVQFESDGGSVVTSATGIRYGTTIPAVTAPTKSGYTFEQWYQEAELISPWDFENDIVTGDAILYAKWTKVPRHSTNTTPTIKTTDAGPQIQPTVTQTTTTIAGQPTSIISLNETQISQMLDQQQVQQGQNPSILVNVADSQNSSIVSLSGDTISKMQQQDANLVVQAGSNQFKMPATTIDLNAAAVQLGQNIPVSQISVGIQISQPTEEIKTTLKTSAETMGFQMLTDPVQYHVIASNADNTVEIKRFESSFTNNILIPAGVDPMTVTTAVEVSPDGTLHHVPTKIVTIDGKNYAQVSSLSAGTCTLVSNQVQFIDAQHHWAQEAINEMGSKMIVAGYGGNIYQPNREMSRAEFSAILVKAIGLAPGIGTNEFDDVESFRWYAGYTETAHSYGILNGISENSFGAQNDITREQAITMIARAMKLTGLEVNVTSEEINQTLMTYRDGFSASDYAQESITKLLKAGIISGRGDQTLALKETISRAEVAVMTKNLLVKAGLI